MSQTKAEAALARVAATCRFKTPVTLDERALQECLFNRFRALDVPIGWEVPLGRGRIDLLVLVEGQLIGIEVKRDRPPAGALAAQLRRYAADPRLAGLVVVLGRRVKKLPDVGVPVLQLSATQAFGVAV